MATLGLGVFASTAAELGVSNDAGVLAVEEDVLHILFLKVRALQDILEIGFSKSYSSCKYANPVKLGTVSDRTFILDQDVRTIIEARCARLFGNSSGGQGCESEENR